MGMKLQTGSLQGEGFFEGKPGLVEQIRSHTSLISNRVDRSTIINSF
jgi:hypothetical protein